MTFKDSPYNWCPEKNIYFPIFFFAWKHQVISKEVFMDMIICQSWSDVLYQYNRHAEECDNFDDLSDGKMVGDCGHKFTYICRCGEPVEIDGYSITSLQTAEHGDTCYACCGCELCRQYTAMPQIGKAARR
jgi:hypothetical protein